MSNGSFTNLEKLNESSSTSVFSAFQVALNRKVLLKVLHKHLANDAALKERFLREARACASLRSEHIVQVYEFTELEGSPAIVMEYVEGRSLKQLLDAEGPQKVKFAQDVAASVLKGLQIAHEHGVVHRDLKPGNILISEKGVVKITDFGLATLEVASTLTNEGTVVGTPAYMSPEQIHGEKVDRRTDFFSLGATLVELVSGKRIFDGKSYAECVRKIAEFKADALDSLGIDVSSHFISFLKRLMAPIPEERFASASEALSALEPESLHSSEVGPGVKRKSGVLLGAVAVVFFIIVFGIIAQRQHKEETQSHGVPDSTVANRRDVTIDSTASSKMFVEQLKRKHEENKLAAASLPSKLSNIESGISRVDSGFLVITSKPWAKVYVNNQYIGETPIAHSLKVESGKHSITFNNPTFVPIVRTVEVRPNAEITVDGDFLETAGYISLQVSPWAEVYIDDQYRDLTPVSKPFVLSAGTRRIRLHNPRFSDIVKEVSIKPNDTLRLSINYPQEQNQVKK